MYKVKNIVILLLIMLLVFSNSAEISNAASDTVNQLKKQIATLKKQVSTLKSENAKIVKENKKLTTELADSKRIIDQLRTGIVELEYGSQWVGSYTASQGETSLTITIKRETAEFEFGPTPNNPNIPYGKNIKFFDHNTNTGFINFSGGKWIQQPMGYTMVDYVGSVSGDYINGVVLTGKQVIGNFSVKKVK